jgi:GNAT superfamily N-acetyltransferase
MHSAPGEELPLTCTLTERLDIVRAGLNEYNQLAHFHYREKLNFPFAAIFAMKETHPLRSRLSNIVGVIVYTTPVPNLSLRDLATKGCFCGLNSREKLQLVNKNVRCISRVIIDPRYRGIGLGTKLVRNTMPRMNIAFIESMAVMGLINPFFQRAGMTAYHGKQSPRTVQMIEAFGMVGIDENDLIDPRSVQQKIESLDTEKQHFVNHQIKEFLRPFAKRRAMPDGLERTRFVLSRLTGRPVYYIWQNPAIDV